MKCGDHIKQGHIKRIDSLNSCITPTAYNHQRLDERYGGLYEEDFVFDGETINIE